MIWVRQHLLYALGIVLFGLAALIPPGGLATAFAVAGLLVVTVALLVGEVRKKEERDRCEVEED